MDLKIWKCRGPAYLPMPIKIQSIHKRYFDDSKNTIYQVIDLKNP